MTAAVAVITDSTACLDPDQLTRHAIRVVPLRVVSGGAAADEGPGALSGALGAELRAGERLSTASPAPATFSAAYAAARSAGARSVVSVHLSGSLSGTVHSARLAAASAPVPVRVVDSRSLGMGLGIAALAAAEAAEAGGALDDVAAVAAGRAARLRSFFVLDTLEQLAAGGRLGQLPSAAPGPRPGLTARPLLGLADGAITLLEKTRTTSAATARLEQLAAGYAAGQRVDVAVQHLGHAERAAEVAKRLEMLIPGARRRYLAEAGPVIMAHTGPGMLGVVVAPY